MRIWEYYILSILAILIGFMACSYYELSEIRKYIEFSNNNPNIASEFAYIKDFMDRNIEYFSVFTGVTVAIVSIIVGFGFKFKYDGQINSIRNEFIIFRKEQVERNKNHETNIESLNSDLIGNVGVLFKQIASVYKDLSPKQFVYLNLISLYHLFQVIKIGKADLNETVIKEINSIIENCSLSINDEYEDDEALVHSLQEQAALISICPFEFQSKLLSFFMEYNNRYNIVKYD